VEWTPKVLNYRNGDHGPYEPFIGEWSDTIKSGKIQKVRPLLEREELPTALHEISHIWGHSC
jgi:hypothetical protein